MYLYHSDEKTRAKRGVERSSRRVTYIVFVFHNRRHAGDREGRCAPGVGGGFPSVVGLGLGWD